MQSIHALLARIRWRPRFGQGDFLFGFWDRLAHAIRHARRDAGQRHPDNPGRFVSVDEEGASHEIPLYRIRAVWRNGELIWQRHGPR